MENIKRKSWRIPKYLTDRIEEQSKAIGISENAYLTILLHDVFDIPCNIEATRYKKRINDGKN